MQSMVPALSSLNFWDPVDRLEFELDTHALGDFFGHINVKADDFVGLIAVSHGRESVVQTEDQGLGILNFFQRLGRRWRPWRSRW